MEDKQVQYQLLLYKIPSVPSRVTMKEILEMYPLLISLSKTTSPENREEIEKRISEYEQLVERMFLRRLGDISDLF